MDPLDIVMKGIIGITGNYGKKIQKNGTAPEIKKADPCEIAGDKFRLGFCEDKIMPDLTKGKTYWIAGHGSGHKMEGVLTDVFISAVWLDCGNDEGIIWITADIIGLTRIEVNKIRGMIMASEVIKGCKGINVSVTHSHSGIDTLGYWGKPFLSIPADGKDPEYMDMLMKKAVEVSVKAYLNRKPGTLFSGKIEVPGGLFTKRGFTDKHEILSRFRFSPDDGSNEVWVMNFGAHPNSLGGGNRMLSGEYPFFMREKIKSDTGADVHFGIGAIGAMDGAELDEDPLTCVKKQGLMYADAAEKITDEHPLEPKIRFITQPFYYPVDNYVLTLLALKHTMSFKAYPCKSSLTGIAMESEMTYMTIGDTKIVLLPGESFVSTVYGSYIPKELSTTGEDPEINPEPLCEICNDPNLIAYGNTNDMTGYVVPPNDFILNKTQPFLNGTKDKNGLNHYHETNSMGINSQKAIADNFRDMVSRF
ncbi:MAG: hypothetical protein IKS39_06505 [Clostridia bacterium]|nr:hypothetical protein [Clostridia bacterium]